jgi:hypothetical protein
MTLADLIILGILAAVVVAALYNLRKRKRTGTGCSGCNGRSNCPSCTNGERNPDEQQ